MPRASRPPAPSIAAITALGVARLAVPADRSRRRTAARRCRCRPSADRVGHRRGRWPAPSSKSSSPWPGAIWTRPVPCSVGDEIAGKQRHGEIVALRRAADGARRVPASAAPSNACSDRDAQRCRRRFDVLDQRPAATSSCSPGRAELPSRDLVDPMTAYSIVGAVGDRRGCRAWSRASSSRSPTDGAGERRHGSAATTGKRTQIVVVVWSWYSTSASASAVFSTTDHITGFAPR